MREREIDRERERERSHNHHQEPLTLIIITFSKNLRTHVSNSLSNHLILLNRLTHSPIVENCTIIIKRYSHSLLSKFRFFSKKSPHTSHTLSIHLQTQHPLIHSHNPRNVEKREKTSFYALYRNVWSDPDS